MHTREGLQLMYGYDGWSEWLWLMDGVGMCACVGVKYVEVRRCTSSGSFRRVIIESGSTLRSWSLKQSEPP